MKSDQQLSVKKRLIYAEDLFEPVDFTVVQMGGRTSGKTMAMYEQLFRKRVDLAPTIDAVPIVRCKDCKYRNNEVLCPMLFVETSKFDDGGGYMVDDYIELDNTTDNGFCHRGERRVDDGN